MFLPGFDVFVPRGRIVDDLQLHAVVGKAFLLHRGPNREAAVGPARQPELEPQDEVRVFLFRQKIAAAFWGTDDFAVADQIAVTCFAQQRPALQGLPVKQRNESRLGILSGSDEREGEKQKRQQQESMLRRPVREDLYWRPGLAGFPTRASGMSVSLLERLRGWGPNGHGECSLPPDRTRVKWRPYIPPGAFVPRQVGTAQWERDSE